LDQATFRERRVARDFRGQGGPQATYLAGSLNARSATFCFSPCRAGPAIAQLTDFTNE